MPLTSRFEQITHTRIFLLVLSDLFAKMQAISSFTRPPHYRLDSVGGEYLEVQSSRTSPLVWVAGWAVAACVMMGIWTASQPSVSFVQAPVRPATTTSAAVPVEARGGI